MSTLAQRLALAADRLPNFTQADLARHVGVKQPSVNGWFSGRTKSLKSSSYEKAAEYFRCSRSWLEHGTGSPGWLDSVRLVAEEPLPSTSAPAVNPSTPAATGMSHAMRLGPSRLTPPKVSWEAVLKIDLPPEFETSLPDNAMAPDAPRGTRVIFLTGPRPEPGDWILAADTAGALFFREYRVLNPTRWVAHALNPAYLPLDSSEHGLRVVAIFDGMRGRKSAR